MSELSTIQQLAAEVDSGNLTLTVHRDKLDEAIKGIQDLSEKIDMAAQDGKGVEYVTGFGGFQIGLDLAARFTAKGSGENGIQQRIAEVQKELKAAQELILKATRAYAETRRRIRRRTEPNRNLGPAIRVQRCPANSICETPRLAESESTRPTCADTDAVQGADCAEQAVTHAVG